MDLNNLYYFSVLVEKQSFSAAAEEIGIPKGTLSKRIRALELALGLRLAYRTTRRFSLTGAGSDFHQHCLRVLEQVRAAERSISERLDAPAGLVRMTCTTDLIHMGLAEVVPRLQSIHPDVDLEISTSNQPVDLVSEGFDIALRRHTGPLRDSSLVVRRVAETGMTLVASPEFPFPHGSPSAPVQLDGIAGIELARCGPAQMWELYGPDGKHATVAYRVRMRCDDALMVRSCVLAGTGVAALPMPLCRADLEQGRLVRVLPDWHIRAGTLSIALPSRQGATPAVRAAVDFLVSALPAYLSDVMPPACAPLSA